MCSQAGLMSGVDIQNALNDKEILIAPLNPKNITPVGYNFSYSMFILSLSTKRFKKIEEDEKGELYFYFKPNETILLLTYEAIKVPNNIGGTFHSKVSLVTDGVGHVSTTLDPGWSGQLLISMNNPTDKKIKITIGTHDKQSGQTNFKSFITLVLFKSITPFEGDGDNKSNRLDLLNKKLNESAKDIEVYNAITSMTKAIEKYEQFCKNEDVSKKEKDKEFIKTYTEIATNNKYLKSIVRNASKKTVRNRFIFSAIMLAFIVAIGVSVFLGVRYSTMQWIAPTLIAVIVSIFLAVVKPLRDWLL